MQKVLKSVYVSNKGKWSYGSVKVEDGVYLFVKLVNESFPTSDGFYNIHADSIWLDDRNPDKEVYRCKGRINFERVETMTRKNDKYGQITIFD